MAKGGHRRPVKRKKTYKRRTDDGRNSRDTQALAKNREKRSRKDKSLLRQMRGMKWDEEEYSEEFEEDLEDNI